MKLLILLLVFGLALSEDEKKTDDNKAEIENVICNKCKCYDTSKTVDCAGKKLNNVFSRNEWVALNSSGKALDSIRFDVNVIVDIPIFPKLAIKYLSFKQNDIEHIAEGAFENLTDLEKLDLSYNRLTAETLMPHIFKGKYDPKDYQPLKKLKTLDLGNNLLHSLDPDIFEHLPNLEYLSLDSNPFKVIDDGTNIAISTILTLRFLDLSYMELFTLPEHIFHRPRQLQMLNLTGNLFRTIPKAISYAVNLTYLSLDENPFEMINKTNAIPHLEKLETLSLSYIAPLTSIDEDSIGHLPELKILMCTNNPHLTNFHPNALSKPGEEDASRREWPGIKYLYLHNNNISILDANLLGRWDAIEVVDIRFNPWQCDCKNQWIVDNLMPKIMKKTPELTNDIICHNPIEMANIPVKTLTDKESHLRCEDYYGHRPERDGAILVGILVGLLIGIPIAFSMLYIYKRGCFGLVGSSGPADYSRAFYKRAHIQEDFHI